MHGRVKVRTTKEQELIKQAERQKKATEFKKGIELIFSKRKRKEWDDEILLITEKLLVRLPDVYTLWNIRREVFLNNNWVQDENTEKMEKELSLTEISLRENPKSYCVWHHRMWILNQLPKPNWKRELALCNKCLELDERNFHCWDYRLFVVKNAKISDSEELEFTKNKILVNFSNCSSWHYRSKILKRMYPSTVHDLNIDTTKHHEELDLVLNAVFTDPNDSSAWIYNKWLLNYQESPNQLWQAVLSDSRITVAFHKEVSPNLKLICNNEIISGEWKSTNRKKYSSVWYCVFEKLLDDNLKEISLSYDENLYHLKQLFPSNKWIYKGETININHRSLKIKEQLDNYKQLSEMEPSNKWVKLASLFIMTNFDAVTKEYSSIIKEWNNLIKVDPYRKNYYQDMRSKSILQHHLIKNEIQKEDNHLSFDINLSNLELTSLSKQEPYLSFFHKVNLSNNSLGNNLHYLHTLQECTELDLSKNNITSLKLFPTLSNLKTLLLSNNKITDYGEIVEIIKKHNLTKLDVKENPLYMDAFISEVKNNHTSLILVV